MLKSEANNNKNITDEEDTRYKNQLWSIKTRDRTSLQSKYLLFLQV